MWRLFAVLFALTTGCGSCGSKSDPPPTCGQVIDHLLELGKPQMTGHGGVDMGRERDRMVLNCEQRDMPVPQRKCIMDAQTVQAASLCRTGGSVYERPRRPISSKNPTGSAAGSNAAGGSGM